MLGNKKEDGIISQLLLPMESFGFMQLSLDLRKLIFKTANNIFSKSDQLDTIVFDQYQVNYPQETTHGTIMTIRGLANQKIIATKSNDDPKTCTLSFSLFSEISDD